jgi:hypothetical protein
MLYERSELLANSPAALAFRILREQGWSHRDATLISTQGATLLFAAISALLTLRLWHATRSDHVPTRWATQQLAHRVWRAGTGITLVYLLVGSFWLQPWYLAWALVLAVLIPDDTLTIWVMPWCGDGVLESNFVLDSAGGLMTRPLSAAGAYALWLIVSLSPLLLVMLGHQALRLTRLQTRRTMRESLVE